MKAYCLIREQPVYRRDAFVKGLTAAGHSVQLRMPDRMDKETVLLIWNRYGGNHDLANRVEAAGGLVLVAENGYLGAGGSSPKFDSLDPQHYYALARGFHNGGGVWHVGEEDRFSRLGIELRPWREGGEYVLLLPNRSFGVPDRMMHPDWPERTAQSLVRAGFKVKVRTHPGNDAPKIPLAKDLEGAQAVVVWYSSAGVHALIEGVPVVCDSPYWICRQAASPTIKHLMRDDVARLASMQRLAWSQWTTKEIESGEPFRHLLPAA